MKHLLSLMSHAFGQGIAWSIIATVGNVLATALSAIALLLLFRFLGPAEAGRFSALLALAMLIAKGADLGMNAAVIKVAGAHSSQVDVEVITKQSILLKRALTVFFLIIGCIVLAALFQFEQIPLWQGCMVLLGMVTMIWYDHLVFAAQNKRLVLSTIVANGMQAGSKLALVLLSAALGWTSLLTGVGIFMLAPLAPLLAWRVLLPQLHVMPPTTQLQKKSSEIRSAILQIMPHTAFLAVANAVLENSDVLLVQRYVSEVDTGLFAGAWRIASLFILVGYSLASVLNPRVSKYRHPDDQRSYILKALLLSGCIVGSFFVLMPLFPILILITIGPQYMESLPVLTSLLLAAFLSLATVPLTALFYQLHADWFFSLTAVGQLMVLVVGYGVFLPQFGIVAAGYTRLLAHGLAFLFALCVVLWVFVQNQRAARALRQRA